MVDRLGGILTTRPLHLLACSGGCTNGTPTRVSRQLIAMSCQNLVPFQIWQSDLKGRGRGPRRNKGPHKQDKLAGSLARQGGPCCIADFLPLMRHQLKANMHQQEE